MITILCGMPVAVFEAIGARDTRGAPWYDRVLFGAAKQDVAMPTTILVDTDGRVAASTPSRFSRTPRQPFRTIFWAPSSPTVSRSHGGPGLGLAMRPASA